MRPLPAHPWTVAAYARWCESRNRHASIPQRLRAIARAHLLAGAPTPDRHPVVERTLLLIEARGRTRGLRARLFPEPTGSPAPRGKPEPPDRSRHTLRSSPRLVARRPKPSRCHRTDKPPPGDR